MFKTLLAILPAALAIATPGLASDGYIHAVATVRPCALSFPGMRSQLVRPGRYVFSVHDGSRSRFFDLQGPDVRKRTSAVFVGSTTWHLRLVKGTYRFQCGRGRLLGGRFTVS